LKGNYWNRSICDFCRQGSLYVGGCFEYSKSLYRVSTYLKVFTEYFEELVMEMPIKFEVSVMQVGNSLRITVPKEVAQHLQVKKGDKVVMYSDNSHVVMEKKR